MTLLGDAAHLMSPFIGEGVNLAMLDGAGLARALIDHPDDQESALAFHQRSPFARRRPIAQLGASNFACFFRPDAPTGVTDFFANR